MVAPDESVEGLADDEFLHHRNHPTFIDDVDDRNEVGMAQLSLNLRLFDKSRVDLVDASEVRVQNLDGDAMAKRLVHRFIDESRAALAYLPLNSVGGA